MGSNHQAGGDRDGAVEAFEIIGNEIRATILYTLGSMRDDTEPPPVVSFSDLRAAIDDDINSSKFNYHLKRLVGRYVERTDDGYRMRPAGMFLYRTIRAGTVTQGLSPRVVDTGIDCYRCPGTIVADSSYGEFWLSCEACDHFYDMVMVPPGTVDQDGNDNLLARLDQYNRHKRVAFRRGICPLCMNQVEPSIGPVEVYPYTNTDLIEHHVHWPCHYCGNRSFASIGMAMIDHPNVVTFFSDHGDDITTTPVWEHEFAMTDRHLQTHSDPQRYILTLTCGGNELELVLDKTLCLRN